MSTTKQADYERADYPVSARIRVSLPTVIGQCREGQKEASFRQSKQYIDGDRMEPTSNKTTSVKSAEVLSLDTGRKSEEESGQ